MEWHHINDKEPPEDKPVLVWRGRAGEGGWSDMFVGRWQGEYFVENMTSDFIMNAVHWRELPKSPID